MNVDAVIEHGKPVRWVDSAGTKAVIFITKNWRKIRITGQFPANFIAIRICIKIICPAPSKISLIVADANPVDCFAFEGS